MRGKGFTLIEMLVVIGIIALLMGIVLPALVKAKEGGRDVLCKNNLREIHRALSMYADENQSYPYGFVSGPYDSQIGDSANDWQRGLWWFHFLDDFHSEEENPANLSPLRCPSRQIKDTNMSTNILCGNYGINYSICKITLGTDKEFKGNPLRPNQIRSTASTLLAMDAGYTLASWKMFARDASVYAFESIGRQDSYFAPGLTLNKNRPINEHQYQDAISGRHGNQKVNAAFMDGHVDRKSVSALEPTFDAQGTVTSKSVWAP